MKKPVLVLLLLLVVVKFAYAQKKYATGAVVNDTAYSKPIAYPSNLPVGSIYEPTQAAISFKAYTPYPRDQDSCESCVGWACAYECLTTMWAIENGITDRQRITENAYDPMYLYLNIAKDCNDPTQIWDALYFIQNKGIALSKDLPGPVTTRTSLPAGKLHRITYFDKVFELNTANADIIEATCNSLFSSQPVVIVGNIDSTLYALKKPNIIWKPIKNGKVTEVAHAMCVIGCDTVKRQFEIMNSWGADWGNDGYFYISFDDFAYMVHYAYLMVPDMGYENGQASIVDVTGDFEIDKKSTNGRFAEIKPAVINNKYVISKGIKQGDIYKIGLLNVKDNVHHYVIGMGPDKNAVLLYPPSSLVGGAKTALIDSTGDNIHVVPLNRDGTQPVKAGVYNYCVLYSPTAVNIAEVLKQLSQKQNKNGLEDINNILGPRIIPSGSINFRTGRIQAQSVVNGGDIVPAFFTMNVSPK